MYFFDPYPSDRTLGVLNLKIRIALNVVFVLRAPFRSAYRLAKARLGEQFA